MTGNSYILAAIFLSAAITFALRLLPFGLKSILKESALMQKLAAWVPLGAMILLAAYALFEIDYSSASTALPYLLAAAVTVAVHLWRKNMVLSMVVGTLVCVVLATWVFVTD